MGAARLPRYADERLDGYVAAVRRQERISADEEVALAQQIEAGRAARAALDDGADDPTGELGDAVEAGEQARQRFVEANLRLVLATARKLQRCNLDLADLVQAGNEALLRAVDGFDWRRGWKFSTYAVWGIRRSMLRADQNGGRAVRLPAYVHQRINEVHRARVALEAGGSERASSDDVAERAGLDAQTVREVEVLKAPTRSLSESTGDGELGDNVVDDGADPADLILARSQALDLASLLKRLNQRERYILALRYGLDGEEPRSLAMIAADVGMSREGVRLVEQQALRRLQALAGPS